jgi:branched-chain amino acid transport system permease protein
MPPSPSATPWCTGCLQFINFAHSEIFAVGAFVGVEVLIFLQTLGVLSGASLFMAYAYLILAIVLAMLAAGGSPSPLSGSPTVHCAGPRLVPLTAAIGVSFLLQDLIRLVEGVTTGQFNRIMPTFGNFDERIIFGKLSMGTSNLVISASR